MALNATIYKVELQITDMDRHYYATHSLTLARHPSETAVRLMVRVLAFALHADERLEFGKGISSDDEPDLWRKDRTGEIEQWIELGQPDEQRVRKACGRARQVVVVNYGGRAADLWWDKTSATLSRAKNLTVIDIPTAASDALAASADRGMRLQCMIQDGQVQIFGDDGAAISLDPIVRIAPVATTR
ncbi:YaeQ family protein [Dokdonella soli]|uniref:YaeQ family protein n=1 Tax=Dokdonella soli TaxID=529810 RepID=A0ABN1IE57_9GAMM